MRRPRKKKLTDADTKPLETAQDTLNTAFNLTVEIAQFCRLHNVTLVLGLSSYDMLTQKEHRRFLSIGPDSSKVGLVAFLGEDVLNEAEIDVEFDDAEVPEKDDGGDMIG